MDQEALKIAITALLPSASVEVGTEWLTINIEPTEWLSLAQQLRNDEFLLFDYLFCVTCVDWKTHVSMVYHLSSTTFRHNMVVKAKLDKAKPEIESVSKIWRTAELHEREQYEMFGVQFLNHPDLRLLILPDG